MKVGHHSGAFALAPKVDGIENINCETSNNYSKASSRQASRRQPVCVNEMGWRESVGPHHMTHADHCNDYENNNSQRLFPKDVRLHSRDTAMIVDPAFSSRQMWR